MLAQAVDAFIRGHLEGLGAGSDRRRPLGGRLNSPALGRFTKQEVAGRIEKLTAPVCLSILTFIRGADQDESLVVFLPRPVDGFRTARQRIGS